MNQEIKNSWNEFKKGITWNNIKMLISGGLPLGLYLYGYTFWMKYFSAFMLEYSKATTIHDSAIALAFSITFIAPLALLFAITNLGFYIGYITKFYRDDKTLRLRFDEVEYNIKDMSQTERDSIKNILSTYKSKLQLKKERLANKSWLRRNFS